MDDAHCTQIVVREGETVLRVPRFSVRVVSGPDAGLVAQAKAGKLVVGSSSACDLVLTDRAVSRFHVEFNATERGIHVRDLGSTNGTRAGAVWLEAATVRGETELGIGRCRVVMSLTAEHEDLSAGRSHFGDLLGSSPAMQAAFLVLERAAPTDVPVLLLGESGTGKELAARALHEASPRKHKPFEIVDCGGLPPTLIESELFGHEKGAFTHAVSSRAGAFERADGGTLFLDELGELPLEVQPKLLRALGEGEVRRVGGARRQQVDVRVVAATNRDLRREVNNGSFRADLFYRIAVVELCLPPLRERTSDLPMLVRHLLGRIVNERRLTSAPEPSPELLAELARQRWPGNLRELRNYLEQLAILQVAPVPPAADFARSEELETGFTDLLSVPWREAKAELVERFERQYLVALLKAHRGNVAGAARAAGVDRGTLFRSMRRLGLRSDEQA